MESITYNVLYLPNMTLQDQETNQEVENNFQIHIDSMHYKFSNIFFNLKYGL